ncbi:dnaK protein [Trichomonas vaginalis G3]|uniref:DnaK protein n=1 Tax=Trichomonas vaginalis (strain ATCC PRA-98 / G3) TaxID=412133 RepID=A2E6E0_TRIV3|nr:ATP binding [Trichomonas vaginalis G3]EAY11753.1 dnaK protein [Trichomonas vaginalis G3]KAI5540612.1 ATP binding [Trichomonas vaginalis G3]|eukprot:XP_001323976.1 dnaK protein [Trichomonas vaginalis G3]
MNHSIHCVGIDLGHKNAIVAVNTNGIIKVCADSSSTKIFPTLISYGEERRFFGDQAQLNQPDNISFTIANLRKLIGLQYNSPDRERIEPDFRFSLCKLENELTGIWCRNFPKPNAFSPEQCIASFLKHLINIAKKEENDPEVNKLYLSVDPDCSNIQRIGLLNAAKIAGIDCELVTSTVAAGAAYIHSHTDKIEQDPYQSKTIYVVDIGDSSLKVSILKLFQNSIEVIAHQQKNEISGRKITELLTEYLLNKISQKYFINLRNDLRNKSSSMHQFLKSVENAKKILSANTSVQFEYQYGDKYISFPINREDFEDIIEEYAEYCASFVNELIETSDDFPTFIELIGGTSRIPLFRKKIEEIGIKVVSNINVDECVAIGCAMKPSLQIADILYRPIEIESENIIVFDALEFIPTITKSFNKIVNFSCKVKVESNGSDYKVYVDSNGVFRVNYDINYVKVTIPNDFSENQIKEFRKIEKSLKKRDKNVIESDHLKIMLESKIYEAEGIFRDMINELMKNKKFMNEEQLSKEKELKKKELLKIFEFHKLDQIANENRK